MLTQQEINTRYRQITALCKAIFQSKGNEYGPTWASYRWVSLCDQLWIKVKRIRQLEERDSLVPESAEVEYMALINYAVIFLMRLSSPELNAEGDSLLEDVERIAALGEPVLSPAYDRTVDAAFDLCLKKNHDYNNAWQEMDIRAITDMVLIKILRMKHIIAQHPTLLLHHVDEQLYDIINYSVFALILMSTAEKA